MLALYTAAALAQSTGITVLEDRGEAVDPGGVTVLRFEADRPVAIHRVVASSTGVGSAWGGTASMYAETTERLCEAPCVLEVANGSYRLRASDNFLFGRRFDVSATGEPLTWRVRDAKPAEGVGGILLSGVGLGGVVGGAMLWALDAEDPTGRTLTLASTPVATVGLLLLVDAFADVRRR